MKLARLLLGPATRLGTLASVILIVLAGAGAALYVRYVIADVELESTVFDSKRMREGFVALSDIHRMSFALQGSLSPNAITETDAQKFEEALDILYVRSVSFGRWLAQDRAVAEAYTAHSALKSIIDLGDEIIADGYAAPAQNAERFRSAAESARGALVSYIDETRRVHEVALVRQSKTLSLLQLYLQITLLFVSGIGLSAILLLHREIVARKQREAAERKADYLAYNDPLTGLANRLRFNEHLAELMKNGRDAAMIFLDLDDFKGINDTYGHGSGDVVLAQIAARLRDSVERYGGMAARLGGDEFGALLTTDNRTKLAYLCDEILESCAGPIAEGGITIHCGVSLGVAMSSEVSIASELSAETMSRSADFALYEAKAAGRGTYRIYDKALDDRYVAHRDLLDAIPAAIENREFFVMYQPKVHLDGLQIYGFEALIRWRRDGVVVQPADFLPVAEEARQIFKLDYFVLGEATQQIAQWNTEFDAELVVSVNLSALHFEDFRIIDEIKLALADSGLAPHLLTLELTETVLLEDWDKVREILGQMHSLGCKISLDDFGTGYSSLAYLRRIQADELKIDRSFVVDIESSRETAYILDAVVDIAQSLGMIIVVEGVENEYQAQIVAGYGCDLGQGFYFGRPAEALVARQKFIADDGKVGGFSLPRPGNAEALQGQAQSA